MTVYLVGISDCESNSIVCVCATKELAIKKMFEERDRLVKEWKEMSQWEKDRGLKMGIYDQMIESLSSDDHEKWENYPHEVPYISQIDVLE